MQEKIKEIAARVRELRDISEVSIEEIAGKLALSVDTYSKYENGEEDIPASILLEIAQILNVDMSVLLTGDVPRMNIFSVTRKDKGVSAERRKDYKYQNIAANFVHKKAEPFVVRVDPKPEGTAISMNSHPGQEFDYVLEGTLKVVIHGNELILEEGDSIFFDSGYEHGMQAMGGKPAKFLAVIL
ncbi:helix-turn-helix domain-containing protein [Methanolobus bombayensis]|uniref:helix-turn-helix domain-containing protein n=1 Tax=Methanolobus bombayensis TaxID=38023 RepID=UPI001AE3FA29|nr:cupin domain-containing protein [Methanolobus bombayensis]MBP1908354.1 transcriptional regulator with XRE-family HTH domain [Methanolobus bombayensis]